MMRAALPLLVLLLSVATAAAAAGEAELSVELRRGILVSGELVRLGDVAELSGPLSKRAGEVLLAAAPASGERLVLGRERVSLRLEQEGFDPASVRVTGAAETVVGLAPPDRSAPPAGATPAEAPVEVPEKPTTMEAERAAALYLAWVRSGLAARLNCPAEVLEVRLSGQLRGEIPAGSDGDALEGRVLWPSGGLRLGRMRLPVEVWDGGKRIARLEGSIEAAARLRVLVAARNIARGDLLLPDDFRESELLLTDLGACYVQAADALAGMCAARDLRAGDPLDARAMQKQKLVVRGQAVTVVSEAGAIKVSERGVARNDGGLGDLIAVELLGNKVQIPVVVTGSGTVRAE